MNKIYINGKIAKIKNLNGEEVEFVINDPITATVMNNNISKDGEIFMIVTKNSNETYLYLESGMRIKITASIANDISIKSMYLNVNQKSLNNTVNLDPIEDPMDDYELTGETNNGDNEPPF